MAGFRFSKEDWLSGKEPLPGVGPVEALLGLVPVNVEAQNGRDRHDNRYGRKRAGMRRGVIAKINSGKPATAPEILAKTRFVVSREIRMPLPDKRKNGGNAVVPPHVAFNLLQEHRAATAGGLKDARNRRDALNDSASVEALLKETRAD